MRTPRVWPFPGDAVCLPDPDAPRSSVVLPAGPTGSGVTSRLSLWVAPCQPLSMCICQQGWRGVGAGHSLFGLADHSLVPWALPWGLMSAAPSLPGMADGHPPPRASALAITSSPRPIPLGCVMHPRVNLWARHLLLSDPIAVCTCVETLFTPNSQGRPFLPWCCGCCHRRACHGCHEPPREAPSPSFYNDLLSTS